MSDVGSRSGERPKLVLFDVGEVLLQLVGWSEIFADLSDADQEVVQGLVKFLEASPEYDQLERGLISCDAFLDAAEAAVARKEWGRDEIRRRFDARLGEEMPGMLELVNGIRDGGLRVAGFSNTSHLHTPFLGNYAPVAALERLLTSCDVHARKPEPESFEAGLAELDVAASDTIFTDDNPANVEGARAVGLRALLFENPEQLRRDLDPWMGRG
ncbi:MAG: HAD family phosphatase [Planctomycetota bacterium]